MSSRWCTLHHNPYIWHFKWPHISPQWWSHLWSHQPLLQTGHVQKDTHQDVYRTWRHYEATDLHLKSQLNICPNERLQSRGKLRKHFGWQLDWNIDMHCLTNALKFGFDGREDHNRLQLFQPQCKSLLARKRSLDKDEKIMLRQWVGKGRYWEVCHLKKRKVGPAPGPISQKSQ